MTMHLFPPKRPATMNDELKLLTPDVDDALKGLGPLFHTLAGKSVLVTGARGYLGKFVVAALIRANDFLALPVKIYALDSQVVNKNAQQTDPRADWRNVPNLRFIAHDVRHDGVATVFDGSLDYVWHLAGIASPYWYMRLPLETIDVAVEGTRNMLKLAKEHGAKFLFTSSSEIYQTANVVPTPEHYIGAVPPLTERSCYDVSKLMGETLCYVAGTRLPGADPTGGADSQHVNIVRIFNSFGVTMGEHDRRILPRIASAIVGRRPLTVYSQPGSRLPSRTYTPVANTLSGLLRVALSAEPLDGKGVNGVYNLGLDSPEVTVPELCSMVTRLTGKEVAYEFKPAPSNYQTEPLRRCPDITRLKALGFLPVTTLEMGLSRYTRWALDTYKGET